MFLKRLEITGFKSFAKKTVLDFSSAGVFNKKNNIGITAIVGPNGSGKSNITDALRWAMGEQSLKNIRGKKSQDVIFAGSGKKAKLGSAQVSIYIDNSQKKVDIDYDEIIITRKIFRSGESEYLINGSQVRLIDVIDILAKIGVGQRSYCIINQGMADQILNASSLERKAIIEEAAGVKEFQVKKERSERKLKSTTNNLERVKSLLKEIEPHLNMLRRQTKKAQKGEEYKKELKVCQEELFGTLLYELEDTGMKQGEAQKEFSRKTAMIQREIDDAREKLSKEHQNTDSIEEDLEKLERKKDDLNGQFNNLEREIIVREGRLALAQERMENIETIQSIPVGTELIREKLNDINEEQAELEKTLNSIKDLKDLKKLKKDCSKIRKKIQGLLKGVEIGKIERRKPNEILKKQQLEREKEIKDIENEIEELKSKKNKIISSLSKTKEDIKNLNEKDRNDRKEAIKIEDFVRRKQFDLEQIRQKYNDVKMELVRVQVKRDDLEGRIKRETQLSPEKIKPCKKKIDVEEMERKIFRLKDKLEQIGAIDSSIVEEYEETEKRYNFLEKESADLEEAVKSLRKVIKELEGNIKEKFETTFIKINKKFKEYFKIIFNGGKADIRKVEIINRKRKKTKEDDLGDEIDDSEENEEIEEKKEIGIEIDAVPPGKKISSLGMLSGGERTLTSLALLFAIISHNPPPFAFLDEVEAALDEANSKRFGRILHELSGKTQFALVTHNRQTMREAAVLYGVTMGGDGVSQLLSVKLHQVGEEGEINK